MRTRASIGSHPLHPILVAFPIGLLVTSFIFDLIARSQDMPLLSAAAWFCVVAGVIGGILAAIPGLVDLFGTVPPNSSARSKANLHAVLNGFVLALFIAVAAYRGGPNTIANDTSLILSGLGIVLIGFSGSLGATLVHSNQITVDHLYANATPFRQVHLSDWNHPVCKASDLAEGQLLLAIIQGARVAVGRCPQGVVAFTDRCTHRGGPLSDGALVGCAVQCPWHGSQFDVVTGRVVAGPAEEHIITYDVVTRGDDVFVYPKRGNEKKEAA
ncbi:MAG TPA: DUF2231 domain-containing protein [Terriglobales bacterium]|nr:DUF2231 domain-containing protein [Terriglobales bacterium]